MKLRGKKSDDKIETQMAPMIDVVFQLLIFFMLTLKIIEPEGDFNINMPIAAPSQQQNDEINLPDIKVRLEAAENGLLNSLKLGGQNLGNDENAFLRLNAEILKIIGRPGNPLTKDVEVEIDADYGLNYEYVIRAVSACTGRFDQNSKQVVRYVEKIKFAPPRREGAPGA
ncbi:MAG: biopolymer transporter ExbD [Planctomycetaceae bacterium]|nr:biopolymer transporter ExbD [Planctomycetaceae bacterium]